MIGKGIASFGMALAVIAGVYFTHSPWCLLALFFVVMIW